MPALADLLLPDVSDRVERGIVDEVRRRSLVTGQRLGVIREDRMSLRTYSAVRLELLTALTYPDSDIVGLTLVNDFLVYAFYVDDQAEEDENYGKQPDLLRRYFEGHMRALRDGVRPSEDDPAGLLLLELRARLLQRASRSWLDRFADDVADYLLWGTVGGARHWTDQTVPTLRDYLARRGTDSGAIVMQTLAEIAGAGELPERVYTSAELHELRRLCGDVVAFTNDLVSYPKEVRRQGSPNNLVRVLMTHEQRSFEDAQTRVIELVNQSVATFEEIAASLNAFDPETEGRVKRYLACQRAWMTHNLSWSLLTGRYADPQHPFPELRTRPAASKPQRGAHRIILIGDSSSPRSSFSHSAPSAPSTTR